MKKYYSIFLLMVAVAFAASINTNAQDFPWPDLGDPMIIEPGAPGTINETILGDTTASGERQHNHYILRRGQLYLYTARILNDGWPLMVTAEDGDGALPVIKALGPPAGEDEAPRAFHAQGDLYLMNLNISGWDQTPFPTDNATVRLASDGVTAVIKDCIFDFNRQNAFRINEDSCKLYVENSLVYNQGQAHNMSNGFAISFRGTWSEMVHFRNNTIVNNTRGVTRNRGTQRYSTLIFDHNTVVNTGYQGFRFGRPDEVTFTNNLYVNPMVLGDAWDGDRANKAEPWHAFYIDSTFIDVITGDDTVSTFTPPVATFNNNSIYIDPAVSAFLPDSSNPASDFLWDEQLTDIAGGDATNAMIGEAFAFNSFSVAAADYQQFIDDYYNLEEVPVQLPGFDLDPTTVDFGYSSESAAATASSTDGPLGDLNWMGGTVNARERMKQVGLKVFPNPVTNYFVVRMDTDFDQVEILNIAGQIVKSMDVSTGREAIVNAENLTSGAYFVRCSSENQIIGVHKFVK